MYARFAAAVFLGGWLVPAAEAAISVNFNVPNQPPLLCDAAENVRLTPAASLNGMRFSFECDGIQRTCQPAPYTPPPSPHQPDPDYLPNAPFVKYQPSGSGAAITVACDTAPGAAPISIKGTEVSGLTGAEPILGCHPATNITFEANIPVESCVAGSGAGNGPCLHYRCPSESTARACFPVAQLAYDPRLPDSDNALRRLSVLCEARPPMLSNEFDG
jgi:hypothetical protein